MYADYLLWQSVHESEMFIRAVYDKEHENNKEDVFNSDNGAVIAIKLHKVCASCRDKVVHVICLFI